MITATELHEGKKSIDQMILLPKDQATDLYLYKRTQGAVKVDVGVIGCTHYYSGLVARLFTR